MVEVRLFEEGTVPEFTKPEWYAGREAAPHLEQHGGHRERLLLASDFVRRAVTEYGLDTVVDLGAGDGGLLSTLSDLNVKSSGYDLQQSNSDAASANRGVKVGVRDVVAKPVSWRKPATTCGIATEMLEHLVDPHAFVRSIKAKAIVASSPWSETNGGAYEFHCWAWDHEGYRALLEQAGYTVLDQQSFSIYQVTLGVRL